MSRILCAIMFVSGAAALLFETLWFRQAGLAFGNGVWASSLVLASFMAGLAIGNGLVARHGARIVRPLFFYGLLEIAIGVAGVALVWLLPSFGGWMVPLWRPLLDQPLLLNALRLFIAFSMLVIPATAMGATLPVLVKVLRAHDPNFGSVLGRLYGWNTLGAVVGSLAGEALLIEWFGVRGSAFVAAALNGVAALTAVAIARSAPFETPAGASAMPARVRVSAPASRLLAAALASGATLLALEVVWFRFLHLFVENTSLGFALVLSIVLGGIGIGGALAGGWLRRDPEAFRFAAVIALAAGAFTAGSYRLFGLAVAGYGTALIREPSDIIWLSVALMLPVSALSGALFVVTGAALEREVKPETRAAGWLTLANTVGGVVGAIVGGFVMLPLLGIELSLFALATSYAVVALMMRSACSVEGRAASSVPPLAAGAAFALALVLFPFGRMEEEFVRKVAERMGEAGSKVVGHREGLTETVTFLERDLYGVPVSYRLVTGGFGMASTNVWARRYMKQFVYLPVALHPRPESALLISFGIGNTAKALTDTLSLERIDVVDISRDVLEMSEIVYPDAATHPLRDPRVNVHIEDGRFFLLTTDRRFDLITSEPPPPKHTGIVNLYTREYFELVYGRLAEGGINTYWLPVHSLVPGDSLAIIRAYCDVFEDCTLWSGAGLNWMLVGTRNARWPVSLEAFTRQWRDPVVAPELRALGFERPEQLGATFIADAPVLRALTDKVLPLVDDFPKRLSDDIDSGRLARVHLAWMDVDASRDRFAASRFIRAAWPEALREATLGAFNFQKLIDRARRVRGGRKIHRLERVRNLHAALASGDLHTLPIWWLEIDDNQLDAMARGLASGAPRRAHRYRLAAVALADRDFAKAADHLGDVHGSGVDPKLVSYLRLYALCRAEELEAAAALAHERFGGTRLAEEDRAYLEWLSATVGFVADF
ncbi:MAG: spermidine synthase [Deltaproteobacteria bacterium]|nr:spermidine synthase [Deltaproteobacteria bacterium]